MKSSEDLSGLGDAGLEDGTHKSGTTFSQSPEFQIKKAKFFMGMGKSVTLLSRNKNDESVTYK